MRRRALGVPLAALAMCGLFLASLPFAAAESPPQADLHSGIAWGAAENVAEASNSPASTLLFAGADGTFSLCWEDNGLWHILLDENGKPLSTARLLGHEKPTFWAGSGSAPYFARDRSGNLYTVWDSSGTEIHLREIDPQGRTLVADRLLRTNPAGAHGPSISADGSGMIVGYTSYEPAFGEYRYALIRLDASGHVTSERFVSPGGGETLVDGAFLSSSDGDVHLVLSTLSDGQYVRVDPSGVVRSRVTIPLLEGSRLPALASSADGTVFIAWNGREGQGSGRIYASRVLNGSVDSIYITSSADAISEPSMVVEPGGGVVLCWLGPGRSSRDICYSVVGTDPWEAFPTAYKMGLAAAPSAGPAVAVGSGRLLAAWPSGTFLSAARGYSYGFELDAAPTSEVRPHQTSSVIVEFRNRGGLADTLSITIDDLSLPPGWSATLSTDEVVLPAGDSSVLVSVLVEGPSSAGGPTGGSLLIRAVSQGNPRLTQQTTLPLYLVVDRRSTGVLSPRMAMAAPGAATSFVLVLSNQGDTDDELVVSAAADDLLSVQVEPALVRLPWSGSANVSVRATVSQAARVGDELRFTVNARSPDSGELISLDAAVVVSPGVQLGVRSLESQKSVLPGTTTNFTIVVDNDGSSPGPADVNLEVVSGAAGWTASIEPAFVQLAAGDEREVSLTVSAPPLATGRFVVRVQAMARDWDSAASTTVTAVALPVHGLRAWASVQRASGLPGTELADRITVSNTGTEPDSIAVAFDIPSGWRANAYFDGALTGLVTLEPGVAVSLDTAIHPPTDALAGEYPVQVIFSGRSGSSATVDLTAAVERVHDLSLDTQTPSLRAGPGDTAVAMVHLRNLGNGPDNFTLGAEAPTGWTATVRDPERGYAGESSLPAGGGADLILEVDVPFMAADSWSDVLVSAASESGLRAVLTFQVGLLLPDLSVSVSYSPQPFALGRTVLATVTVYNAGEAPARDVQVEFSVDNGAGTQERIVLIPGGSSKTATFGWTPSAGRHLLKYEADPEHTILERDESNNILLDRVFIEGPAAAPAAPAPAVMAAAGGGVILAGVVAVAGGTEQGKYWLLGLLFVPLYTKIKKDDVLDHFVRGQVYGYIKANPGEHYNSIKKALSLKNGTLVYHLKTLEREEFIKSVLDGRFKRFYPREMKVPEPSEEIVLRMNHIQHEILRIIRENPGITQKEIAAKIGLSTPTIHYHINIMMSARIINVKRAGRETQCFVEEVEEGKAG